MINRIVFLELALILIDKSFEAETRLQRAEINSLLSLKMVFDIEMNFKRGASSLSLQITFHIQRYLRLYGGLL